MALVDYRGTGDASSSNAQAINSSHGAYGALNDNNDSTYINFSAPPGVAFVDLNLSGIVVNANQRVAQVGPHVRYNTTGTTDFYAIIESGVTGNQATYEHWTDNWGATAWRNTTMHALDPDGNEWSQAALNGRFRLQDNGGGSGRPNITEALIEIDIRTQRAINVTAPSGAQTTATPTVTWTQSDPDGQGQRSFQVKVFTAAAVAAGGFNPDTSTATYDSGVQKGYNGASQILTWTIAAPLSAGSYYAYVRSSKNFNQTDWYSPWAFIQFSYTNAPPTPTGITPANGATVSTDTPTLTAFCGATNTGARVKVHWQLAKDSSFTQNVIDAIEPNSALRISGQASMVLSAYTPLTAGTWYIRAREEDQNSVISDWSAPNQFTNSHIASATSLQPSGDTTVSYGTSGIATLSWTFTSSSASDYQTSYQVIVESNVDGTLIWGSGVVASNTSRATVTVPGFYKNTELRWKVLVYDRNNSPGPYSAYALFLIGDAPTVTITSPIEASVITTSQPTITWTFVANNGTQQKQYRITATKGGTVRQDTGWVPSTTASFTPTSPWLDNGSSYTITVYVQGVGGLTGAASVNVTTSWGGGAAPTAVLTITDYDSPTGGSVGVSWAGATVTSGFGSWRVYRRATGTTPWKLIYETFNSGTTSYNDYLAPTGSSLDYSVVQTTFVSGAVIESAYNVTSTIPVSSHYWLINPNNPADNTQLYSVIKDDPSEEYETTFINLPGRGRHVEYGTRYGWKGQIEGQLRDNANGTARAQKAALLKLRSDLTTLYLRNPFGDVWQVAIGDLAISRISGVGTREFTKITFPYEEVTV